MYTIAFTPSAELAFHTVMSDLSKFRSLMMQAEVQEVCIDLSGVSLCDSAGLALLIEAKRLCVSHGKALVIQKIPEQVRALAEFCGVKDLWSMV